MGKFDDLKKQMAEVEAQAAARAKEHADQARSFQEEQARVKAEHGQRVIVLTNQVVKPVLEGMFLDLGIKDPTVVEKHDQISVTKVTPGSGSCSIPGTRLMEYTFKKPPVASPSSPTIGLLFLMDLSHSLHFFVGGPIVIGGAIMKYQGDPTYRSETGVPYQGATEMKIETAGEFGEAKAAAARERLEDALVVVMKRLLG